MGQEAIVVIFQQQQLFRLALNHHSNPMPFTKITTGKDKGKYKSPSGKVWTKQQVIAYHVTNGFKRPVKKTA